MNNELKTIPATALSAGERAYLRIARVGESIVGDQVIIASDGGNTLLWPGAQVIPTSELDRPSPVPLSEIKDGETVYIPAVRHRRDDDDAKSIGFDMEGKAFGGLWINPQTLAFRSIPVSGDSELQQLREKLTAAELEKDAAHAEAHGRAEGHAIELAEANRERDEWKRRADHRFDRSAIADELAQMSFDPDLVEAFMAAQRAKDEYERQMGVLEVPRERPAVQYGIRWMDDESLWLLRTNGERVTFPNADIAEDHRTRLAQSGGWEVAPLAEEPAKEPAPQPAEHPIPLRENYSVPKGYEYTGETRIPKTGEWYLGYKEAYHRGDFPGPAEWPILRKIAAQSIPETTKLPAEYGLPDGFEYRGEMRNPASGEWFIAANTRFAVLAQGNHLGQSRPIIYKLPEKPAEPSLLSKNAQAIVLGGEIAFVFPNDVDQDTVNRWRCSTADARTINVLVTEIAETDKAGKS